jgi:ArsR family transcriptional regulator
MRDPHAESSTGESAAPRCSFAPGSCSVGALAVAVGMEASAVSQQLRQLRHLGLVTSERQGKHVIYGLHDAHLAELLDQAVFHVEHLRLGARQPIDAPATAS